MSGGSTRKKGVSWKWWVTLAILIVVFVGFSDPLSYPRIGSKGYLAELCNNGKQLVVWLQIYAKEHHGAFPRDLKEMERSFGDSGLNRLLKSLRGDGQPPGWIYFNPSDSEPAPDHPVFVSPLLRDTNGFLVRWFRFNVLKKPNLLPVTAMRVIATTDGKAKAISEEEFQALIAKHHITMPVASPATK